MHMGLAFCHFICKPKLAILLHNRTLAAAESLQEKQDLVERDKTGIND